jgi:hypothetical protein
MDLFKNSIINNNFEHSILIVIIKFFLNIFDISVKCPWWGLTWGVGLGIAGMILKYGVILGWDGHFFYQEGTYLLILCTQNEFCQT